MEHFVWDINPEIFTIGSFGPRYYGLMFAIGFLVSYRIVEVIWKREGKSVESVSSLLVHVMVGTIVGARLGHCLFYDPGYYLSNPLEILYVWKGGLASHGGTMGVMVAVFLYCKKNPDQPYGWLADRLATTIPFGAACIRIGNFFNSEILGRPSDVPWAVVFKRIDNIPRHPAMLYEALSYLILFSILMLRYFKGPQIKPGSQIGLLLIWIFSSRIFLEFFKENQVAFEEGMILNMGQILSIPFVIVGVLLFTGAYQRFLPSGYDIKPATDGASGNSSSGSNGSKSQKKKRK